MGRVGGIRPLGGDGTGRHLVPPGRNMGGRKRVRSDKTDMPNFLASDLDLYPPQISLQRGRSQIGKGRK